MELLVLNGNMVDTHALIGQTKKRKFYQIHLKKETSNTRIKPLLKMNEFMLRHSSYVDKKFPPNHFD